MNTSLTTRVTLADAVYKIAEIVHEADDTITHVRVETSDQGEYLTVSGVRWGNLRTERYLEEVFDDTSLEMGNGRDIVVEIEDWANQLSWDDAHGTARGWAATTSNRNAGYYEIDIDEALKADEPVEIKPVDLIVGTLSLHRESLTGLTCKCGEKFDSFEARRRHVAEQIVEVLS